MLQGGSIVTDMPSQMVRSDSNKTAHNLKEGSVQPTAGRTLRTNGDCAMCNPRVYQETRHPIYKPCAAVFGCCHVSRDCSRSIVKKQTMLT